MFNLYPNKLINNNTFISPSCLIETQDLLSEIRSNTIKTKFSFKKIFEYLYLLRIYKQWILTFDQNCHQLKKDIDLTISHLFDELNNSYSDLEPLTAYFFSPHRYSLKSIEKSILISNDLEEINSWLLSCNDSPIHSIKSSDNFSVQSSYLKVNSLFSYSFLIYQIHSLGNKNNNKTLITDGTLPTKEILNQYSNCIVINGLHLSELNNPKIQAFITQKILKSNTKQIDICIGLKDWLRINSSIESQDYFSQDYLKSISIQFKKKIEIDKSINLNYLNFQNLDKIISGEYFDIWGYKIVNSIVSGTSQFFDVSYPGVCKLHSHKYEHKLSLSI